MGVAFVPKWLRTWGIEQGFPNPVYRAELKEKVKNSIAIAKDIWDRKYKVWFFI
jgi:hypothetical protein